MKKNNIEKHVNIHIITLLVTIFVVVILDSLKIYSISPVVICVFLVGYSLYIVISTIWLLGKNDYLEQEKEERKNKKNQKKA